MNARARDGRRLSVRATSGSREAIARCAVELLGARAEVRVEAIEARGACRIEARGEGIDEAIAKVTGALEGRVEIAEAAGERGAGGDAWDPKEWLAGFATEAIDHTADEAFAVTARGRADLLAAAAEALGGLIVLPGRVRPEEARAVSVKAPEAEWADDDRLFAWLAEVLFTLDAGRFALRRAVVFEDDERGVRGAVFGEPIDEARHEVRGEIKAVTYHGLTIEEVESPSGASREAPLGSEGPTLRGAPPGPEGPILRATVVVDV